MASATDNHSFKRLLLRSKIGDDRVIQLIGCGDRSKSSVLAEFLQGFVDGGSQRATLLEADRIVLDIGIEL